MKTDKTDIAYYGYDALGHLAETYQQLYVAPGENSGDLYKSIVLRGEDAPEKDLSHFIRSKQDSLAAEDTPAGPVSVLTLHERQDFELFLQIIGNRCMPCEVPVTQGASIFDGLINWVKIRQHKEEYIKKSAQEGIVPDWPAEFRRFTSDKKNYTDALIVLSCGPYSNIPAKRFGFTEDQWLKHSHDIRKFHECTHFICRRMFPQKIDAVWDELVADAVGIHAAFGAFDMEMEEAFLGIQDGAYIGGRLQNYASEKCPSELSKTVHRVLQAFCGVFQNNAGLSPYEMAVKLEDQKEALWDND